MRTSVIRRGYLGAAQAATLDLPGHEAVGIDGDDREASAREEAHRGGDCAVQLVVDALGGLVFGRRIAVLGAGAAFRPFSDDIRDRAALDSPALDVAVRLRGLGADVVVTDLAAAGDAAAAHPRLGCTEDRDEALRDADAVVIVTECDHDRRGLSPLHAAGLVRGRVLIDARNRLDATAWRAAGWSYHGVGTL